MKEGTFNHQAARPQNDEAKDGGEDFSGLSRGELRVQWGVPVRSLISHFLIKAVVSTLLALLLFGAFPATSAVAVLLGLAGLRLFDLALEILRRPLEHGDWAKLQHRWTAAYRHMPPEGRALDTLELGLPPHASDDQLAEARVRQAMASAPVRRPRAEIGAEALGLATWLVLFPACVALYSYDFVSLRMAQEWRGLLIILSGVALYAWPHLWARSPQLSTRRIAWWLLPFLPALLLAGTGVTSRHPYLDPARPDRRRLAAERVISLSNNVTAGRHADWVLDYARDLDAAGDRERAAFFFREGLRLNPQDLEAQQRLDQLDAARIGYLPPPSAGRPKVDSHAPLLPAVIPPGDHRPLDDRLIQVDGCTVVIQAVGEVPDRQLDAVAYAIQHELELPVVISTAHIPLPAHTRQRGLLGGQQWAANAILLSLNSSGLKFPDGPLRWIIVTPADIYMADTNFVFSASSAVASVISTARFGGDGEVRCSERAAKQSVCALMKSMGVRSSVDRACVTSYSRSLDEFDAKGNRPNAEALAAFHLIVTRLNADWLQFRTTRDARR